MVSCQERSPTRLCPFSVFVQHPSGNNDDGETLDGFQGGVKIRERIVTNLRLLATSEAEL